MSMTPYTSNSWVAPVSSSNVTRSNGSVMGPLLTFDLDALAFQIRLQNNTGRDLVDDLSPPGTPHTGRDERPLRLYCRKPFVLVVDGHCQLLFHCFTKVTHVLHFRPGAPVGAPGPADDEAFDVMGAHESCDRRDRLFHAYVVNDRQR